MHKYAAATALVIALNITMLTPAVSGGAPRPIHEEDCDGWRLDWGRTWAIGCHCSFECKRQHSYTVTLPCSSSPGEGGTQRYEGWSLQPGRHEGLCDVTVHPFEAIRACVATCVKAEEAAQRWSRQ
jgi:hypothetical protein